MDVKYFKGTEADFVDFVAEAGSVSVVDAQYEGNGVFAILASVSESDGDIKVQDDGSDSGEEVELTVNAKFFKGDEAAFNEVLESGSYGVASPKYIGNEMWSAVLIEGATETVSSVKVFKGTEDEASDLLEDNGSLTVLGSSFEGMDIWAILFADSDDSSN